MSSRIPSYRLHRPTGQAVVTLAGKDRSLGRHGTPESRVAYKRLVAEWVCVPHRLPESLVNPNDLTVNELLLAYWEHVRAYYVKDGRPPPSPATSARRCGPSGSCTATRRQGPSRRRR